MSYRQDNEGATPSLPLVTLAMIAYNQERFIREAVDAALAQTYSPLEIILSDDCSSDRTYDIIRERASTYSGPHRLIVVRNERNQGVGGHINKLAAVAKGELTVIAAGDDMSLPNRVASLVDTWVGGGKRAHSIYSGAITIDVAGKSLGTMGYPPKDLPPVDAIGSYMDGVMGCTHAWSRDVFSVFGPLLPDTVCEDRVIALRSLLLGGIAYCPEPLVKYRIHGGNLSHHSTIPRSQIHARSVAIHARNLNIAENYVRDLERAAADASLRTAPWIPMGLAKARSMRRLLGDKLRFHEGGRATKCLLVGKYLLLDPIQAVKWFVLILTPWLYVRLQKRNLGLR